MRKCAYCGQDIPAEKPCWACRETAAADDARRTFVEAVHSAIERERRENRPCDAVFVCPTFARPHCPDRSQLDGATIVYDVNCPYGEAYGFGRRMLEAAEYPIIVTSREGDRCGGAIDGASSGMGAAVSEALDRPTASYLWIGGTLVKVIADPSYPRSAPPMLVDTKKWEAWVIEHVAQGISRRAEE